MNPARHIVFDAIQNPYRHYFQCRFLSQQKDQEPMPPPDTNPAQGIKPMHMMNSVTTTILTDFDL
jgi:hypothetical protein